MDPVIGGAIIQGLGGIFGRGRTRSPGQNIISQVKGVNEAAERYGYNRLTLLQNGQTGGSAQGASAPLSSNELLMGGLQDFVDVFSGETAQRRAANQLELDLGKIKLEQLRAMGGVASGPSLGAPALLGRQASPAVASAPVSHQLKFSTVKDVPVPIASSVQEYTTSSGPTIPVPVGPDLDEVISGLAIETAGHFAQRGKDLWKTGSDLYSQFGLSWAKTKSKNNRKPKPGWADDLYPKGRY